MSKNIIILYFQGIINQYKFSDVGSIGEASFDYYITKLNPNQTKIIEDEYFKRIVWEDLNSFFIIRFSKNGEFLLIEKEVWYEFRFPFFSRKVYQEINKG